MVNSHSDRPPVDHHRLMLQATGIVRFANTFLDAYKENKNFVFVAIFIDDTGLASRYFLYQGKSSDEVGMHSLYIIKIIVLNCRRSIAGNESSSSA